MGFILFSTVYEIVKSYTFLRKLIFIKYGGKNVFLRSKIPFLKDQEKITFWTPFLLQREKRDVGKFYSLILKAIWLELFREFSWSVLLGSCFDSPMFWACPIPIQPRSSSWPSSRAEGTQPNLAATAGRSPDCSAVRNSQRVAELQSCRSPMQQPEGHHLLH